MSETVDVCGPQHWTSLVSIVRRPSFSRLASAAETVSFAEPVIAPVHATGTDRPRRAIVAADSRDETVPSRAVAGVSISGGRIVDVGADGSGVAVVVEPCGGPIVDLERDGACPRRCRPRRSSGTRPCAGRRP